MIISGQPPHTHQAKAPLCPQGAPNVSSLADEQALAWFVALNRASVTDTQRMAFNRWLALDPEHRSSYRAVLSLWERLEPAQVAR